MYKLVFAADSGEYEVAWVQTSNFLNARVRELIGERPEQGWTIDPLRASNEMDYEFRMLIAAESGSLRRVLTIQPPFEEWLSGPPADENPVASAHIKQRDEFLRNDQLTLTLGRFAIDERMIGIVRAWVHGAPPPQQSELEALYRAR